VAGKNNYYLRSVSRFYCNEVFSSPFCAKRVRRKRPGKVYFFIVESDICFFVCENTRLFNQSDTQVSVTLYESSMIYY